jgi:hypothetical protein
VCSFFSPKIEYFYGVLAAKVLSFEQEFPLRGGSPACHFACSGPWCVPSAQKIKETKNLDKLRKCKRKPTKSPAPTKKKAEVKLATRTLVYVIAT